MFEDFPRTKGIKTQRVHNASTLAICPPLTTLQKLNSLLGAYEFSHGQADDFGCAKRKAITVYGSEFGTFIVDFP